MKDLDLIIIATNNKGKLNEFKEILNKLSIRIESLNEYEQVFDIEEDGQTFEENAIKKAETICNLLNKPTIADDSGLMVDMLNGLPGIYSARFAGEDKSDQKNNEKLLTMLQGVKLNDRKAEFVCAIALAIPKEPTIVVKGSVNGLIALKPQGTNGFGYDPLFYLPEYDKTMAELKPEEKNKISHRALALEELFSVLGKRK